MKDLKYLRAYNLIAALLSAGMTIYNIINRDYAWAIVMVICTAANHMAYNQFTNEIKSRQNEKDNRENPS